MISHRKVREVHSATHLATTKPWIKLHISLNFILEVFGREMS